MEATSTVVVEAIENNLPVLCFDTCGFGNIIDSSIGFKIPLLQYNTSVIEFKRVINELSITELNQLALNCRHRVGELSWSNKARIVSQIYNHLNMDYITVSR
jgi:glycosyltransferase involved in cell wall biosynthesis